MDAFAPDIVFLDVSMPVTDGWTLSRQLRDAGYSGPIVMVSANAYENLPGRRKAAGCDDFIVKPVLETELFARLSTWLGLAWIYAENGEATAVPAGARAALPPALPADTPPVRPRHLRRRGCPACPDIAPSCASSPTSATCRARCVASTNSKPCIPNSAPRWKACAR